MNSCPTQEKLEEAIQFVTLNEETFDQFTNRKRQEVIYEAARDLLRLLELHGPDSIQSLLEGRAVIMSEKTIQAVLVAGNHLASSLLPDVEISKTRSMEYWDFLEKYGQPSADMWVAWKAIMNLSEAMRQAAKEKRDDQ